MSPYFFRFLLSFVSALVFTACTPIRWVYAQALPVVQITGVTPDLTSCKVDYAAVAKAKDYRAIVDGNMMVVKYAGLWHLDADQLAQWSRLHFAVNKLGHFFLPLVVMPNADPVTAGQPWTSPDAKYHHADVPALEIEMNGLTPGPHTLVIQAVDALGPAPTANAYDANNLPLMNAASMSAMGGEGMDTMLGANAGTTSDGMVSTNGQGPSTNNPNVIAQSPPFTVTIPGTGNYPIAGALDSFFDTFPSGTFAPVGARTDVKAGNQAFVLTTPAGAWDVLENHCDIRDTKPFVMNRHFMAVAFDGGSPGSNEPLHVAYGAVAISPQKVADISGGKILDSTMEVDAHTDARRWVGFAVGDATDPFTAFDWEEKEQVNKANTGIWVQWEGNVLMVDEIVGGHLYAICGAAGQASHATYRSPFQGWQMGRGLDDRTSFRYFLSQNHFAVYEDGAKEAEFDLPVPLPFTHAKVYDVQYLYHSDLEKTELQQQRPFEQYWIADFPSSDERHWANCGWETLPATMPWASLSSLAKLPAAQPPEFAPPPVTLTPAQASTLAGLNAQVGSTVSQDVVREMIAFWESLLPGGN